jgi:hypothetical protein
VQQVADDREDNCPADPDRHAKMPFIDLLPQVHERFNIQSLKVCHGDLQHINDKINGENLRKVEPNGDQRS